MSQTNIKMKKYIFLLSIFITLLFLTSLTPQAEAASRVRGYYKKSTGSYVMPHYRTSPNRSKFDNYSTKGNYNPYTGKSGTVNPFRSNYRR